MIIFLGGKPSRGIRFRAPGPMHNARWMSKAIYSIKVWLFRQQSTIRDSEAAGLLKVCLFIASAYVESWYSATNPATAPRVDLQFSKRLKEFASVDKNASGAALKKFVNHLWYLSEELIPLALFDEDLPEADRRELAESLEQRVGDDDPTKKLSIPSGADLVKLRLPELGTTGSMQFFSILSLSADFLSAPVNEWSNIESYRRAKAIVDNLKVVNDHAERGVKLMNDYNRIITKKEEHYQDLLIAVGEHRKILPKITKKQLNITYG